MSSEITPITPMPFEKVPRCYKTKRGCRLATYEEARDNLDMIIEHQLLKDWERARLLNGWISGPCHNFQMGDGYRGCIGYMLTIQKPESCDSEEALYGDVSMADEGKRVALLLCSEDWNYEVVYWVLNSLSQPEAMKMDPSDVRGGKIPFPHEKFEKLNKMVNDVAITFGGTAASEKAANTAFSSYNIEDVIRERWVFCWKDLDEAHKKSLGCSFESDIDVDQICLSLWSLEWLPKFASQRDVADAMWNFIWDNLLSQFVAKCAHLSLGLLISEWSREARQLVTTGRQNLLVSTSILFYLSYYKWPFNFSVKHSIEMASSKGTQDAEHFKENIGNLPYLKSNKIKSYGVLEKALHVAASYTDLIIFKKALDCGANPLSELRGNTALILFLQNTDIENEDEVNAFVKSLFAKCNNDKEKELANAKDSRGWTALHYACAQDYASTFDLLLDYGGRQDALDENRRPPLFCAVARGAEKVLDVLIKRGKKDEMQSRTVAEMITSKDIIRESLLDVALRRNEGFRQNKMKVVAKLLSLSRPPLEDYVDRVDSSKLLRECALEGYKDIMEQLLNGGADTHSEDKEGQTTLHYTARSADESKAIEIFEMLKSKDSGKIERLVAKCDRMGRTALHIAAFKGHKRLCKSLTKTNSHVTSIKDSEGQVSLYHAVKGDHDDPSVLDVLTLKVKMDQQKLENSTEDADGQKRPYLADKRFHDKLQSEVNMNHQNLRDFMGLTPLHVAASAGKINWVRVLLSSSEKPKSYIRIPDRLGQTALHKAAKEGHLNIVEVLLDRGARPLLERDCDGRTALHYAVQTQTEEKGIKVVKLLLSKFESEGKKLLFLWASAAGLGTADENLNYSPLKHFLEEEKKNALTNKEESSNLTRIAATTGDIEMTKELLTRGGQIQDIEDKEWRGTLSREKNTNVKKVLKQIESITEHSNDQPATFDDLGRYDIAYGLAALLLNPYLKPPIAVGISGNWGMGKSSIMKQTEIILLKTTAQLGSLASSQSSSNFPGVPFLVLSKKGKKKYQQVKKQIDFLQNDLHKGFFIMTMMEKLQRWVMNDCFFMTMMEKLQRWVMNGCFFMTMMEKLQRWVMNGCFFMTMMEKFQRWMMKANIEKEEDSLVKFLGNYEVKYHSIFKSLAAMDSSDMFTTKGRERNSSINSSRERSVPAILTVQYNAWKYRSDVEAFAGLAVEITKEMEGTMSLSQWFSTALRNAWKKQKREIWMKVIFPSILAIFLASTFTFIVWLLLDSYEVKQSVKLKYASLPVSILIVVWTLVKTVMSTISLVSSQMMSYINFPDHSGNLGYQERVISDITFLKGEIGRKPSFLCRKAACMCQLISRCITSLLGLEVSGESRASVFAFSASANPRIIVFVDDLDRCHESVILKILSAINLVLAVCEINVIVGMDKAMIERAIIKKHGDMKNSQQLADHYLQKIIQVPIDLPEPDTVQSKRFLKKQLGVEQSIDADSETEADETYNKMAKDPKSKSDTRTDDDSERDISEAETNTDDDAFFSVYAGNSCSVYNVKDYLEEISKTMPGVGSGKQPGGVSSEAQSETNRGEDVRMDMPTEDDRNHHIFCLKACQHACKNLVDWIRRQVLFKGGRGNEEQPNLHTEMKKEDQAETVTGDENTIKSIPIKKMVFIRYNNAEQKAFKYFQKLATGVRKLPREWKRMFNYHRLVWNILFISNAARDLPGWQIQLITWTFICWEWQENINFLVHNWNKIVLEASKSKSSKPSLKEIVEHCAKNMREILEESFEVKEMIPRKSNLKSDSENAMDRRPKELIKKSDFKNVEKSEESGNFHNTIELEKENDSQNNKDNVHESEEKGDSRNAEVMAQEKLEEDIQTLSMQPWNAEVMAQEKLEEDIQTLSMQPWKSEKGMKMEEDNWKRLQSTLNTYDVSMDGIQVFQRFRFYCIAGYLPWPLSKEENEYS